jgi:hypothetical protein
MKRRELLFGAGSLAAAGAVWLALRDVELTPAASAAERLPHTDPLLHVVCDLVIPDTDTPGAGRAGVPQFLALAVRHNLGGSSPADIAALQALLDHSAAGSFLGLTSQRQFSILERIDSATGANAPPVWSRIKKLVLMGYYTSQIGASQELQYQLVPGRYDPDLPVTPGDRAWSSDWVGQGF